MQRAGAGQDYFTFNTYLDLNILWCHNILSSGLCWVSFFNSIASITRNLWESVSIIIAAHVLLSPWLHLNTDTDHWYQTNCLKNQEFYKAKKVFMWFFILFFWKIHSKQIQTVKWNILFSMTMQLRRQICTNVKKYFYISECRFGGESYELEQTWNPDLGPPFGVMHCVHCECVPVGVTTDASILY